MRDIESYGRGGKRGTRMSLPSASSPAAKAVSTKRMFRTSCRTRVMASFSALRIHTSFAVVPSSATTSQAFAPAIPSDGATASELSRSVAFAPGGSGMGNPNVHDHTNLPILVAGGAAGHLKGGRHIKYAEPTPLANLHLTLLEKAGVHLDKFADSRGKVNELLTPLSL